MSRVDILGVVGCLVVCVRVIDVGDDCEGFRRARGPLCFRGYSVLRDDGWRSVTARMLYRTTRWASYHRDNNCTTSVVEGKQSL
jgi:hypothetical protein